MFCRSTAMFLCGPFVSARVFELTWCRRLACYTVGVVGGNAISGDRKAGCEIDKRSVRVGGAVADDHPGRRGAGPALDGVLDREGGAAPGNDVWAFVGDDRGGRNGVRRHGKPGNFEGMSAQEFDTGGHVVLGHSEGLDAAVVERPPLAAFTAEIELLV
jgi:hypothetical protein